MRAFPNSQLLYYFFSSLRSWPLYSLLRQRIDLSIQFATQYLLPPYFFALTAVYLPHTLSLTIKIKRIYLPVIRLVDEEYFVLQQILWLTFTDCICCSRMTAVLRANIQMQQKRYFLDAAQVIHNMIPDT